VSRWDVKFPVAPVTWARGVLREYTIPAPAAGADWSLTVTDPGWWRLRSAFATLTVAGAGNNQVPGMQLSSASGIMAQGYSASFFATTGAKGVTWITAGPTAEGQVSVSEAIVPVPGLFLQPGGTFASQTKFLQAGDQWSSVLLYLEQILEGQWGDGGTEHQHRVPILEIELEA
jgi:hypothetical protein